MSTSSQSMHLYTLGLRYPMLSHWTTKLVEVTLNLVAPSSVKEMSK